MARIAVVGAGIAGLAAAWELESAGVDVVVFEAGDRIGGKIRSSPVDGVGFVVDEGADAFLARVPEALELCQQVGIDDLVHPAVGNAHVYARGRLRPLPAGQLLGVPTDLAELASSGLVSDEGLRTLRERVDQDWAAPDQDCSVAELVGERLAAEVCTNVVEPLLGGINAGEAAGLSAKAVAPQIWAAASAGGSLMDAARRLRNQATNAGPVFATPRSGVAALPAAIADRLSGEIRTNTPVAAIGVTRTGVEVDGDQFDAVVVATPAPTSASLLANVAPEAAGELRTIEFASVVMVALVADASSISHPLDGSGFVVARNAGLDITAGSWGSSKWAHWDDGEHVVFRVSIGHDSDPTDWCAADDGDLIRAATRDLQAAMDIDPAVIGTRVTRWRRSFPQYRPGHLDRVATISESVANAGRIAIAGSSLYGIGIPACIRHGRSAARQLLD